MPINMRVTGQRKAKRALKQLTTDMHDAQEAVAALWAEDAHTQAVADVPRDTGNLAGAIEKRVYGKREKANARVGVYDEDAYYSQFVEFGTSQQAAQPFMYPAASQANRKVAGWMREEFDKRLPEA